MSIVNTKIHGMVDYMTGVLLMISPIGFQFYDGGMETWIPVALGTVLVVYSLLTNYELGLVGIISMRTHLFLDLLLGVVLAISPWLFHFNKYVYLPHLCIGALLVCVTLMSSRTAFKKYTPPENIL